MPAPSARPPTTPACGRWPSPGAAGRSASARTCASWRTATGRAGRPTSRPSWSGTTRRSAGSWPRCPSRPWPWSTGSRPGPGCRWLWPATCGWPATPPAGGWPSPASAWSPTPARPGTCPGSSGCHGRWSWPCSATGSTPTRRCGSGWSTGSGRPRTSSARPRRPCPRWPPGRPWRFGRTKALFRGHLGTDLAGALAGEAEAQVASGQTKDHLEGVTAFLEKRPPNFQGA